MYRLFQEGDYPPLRRWKEPAQTVFFAMFAFVLYLMVGFILTPFGFAQLVKEQLSQVSGIDIFAVFVFRLTYPFVATIVAQWLPMVLLRWTRKPVKHQMLFAGAWFAFLHLKFGFSEVVQKFFVGWVLAACFVFCRKDSWTKAYRVTSIAHAIFNTMALVYILLLIWLS
jgi:hypothetical protein